MLKHLLVVWMMAAALLAGPGCVELEGQRLTWYYNAETDEFQILMHYDGIHDSTSDKYGKGVEQIPKFVKGGDVLLWGWPFHMEMAGVREKAEDKDAKPREREWAQLIASIKIEPVGYYREPDGHIGAAQLITIPKAKDFIRKLNALINAEIVEEKINPDHPMVRTQKRMQVAAKKGHQWIGLQGNAVRFTLPVHPGEWQRAKFEFLEELAREVGKVVGQNGSEEQKKNLKIGLVVLACPPLSYIDDGDRVEFRVGRTRIPTTVRAQIRDEYEPSLEKVLIDSVKVDLDKELAKVLLDKEAKPRTGISAILKWGPPEDQVRALIAAAEGGDDKQKKAAIDRLGRFAKQFNRDYGLPEAPRKIDDPEDYLAAWKEWYGKIKRRFLVNMEKKVKKEKEKAEERKEEKVPPAPAVPPRPA